MTFTRKQTLQIWGVLDLFQLVWYSLHSWRAGRIPYLSDLFGIQALGEQVGAPLISVGLVAWSLQLTIAITAVGFLLTYRPTRYLGMVQIPLRLFFIVPSLSPLLLLAGYLPGLLMLALTIGSETLKAWSLWRRT
ncbi:hypothetical protein NNO07_27895 [Pseudomonas resinovorans]|uniref:Arginine:ornithine antiporter n=1 Tax=Metapseudomonas resinovorans TaxID=53412 RepID=A0ABT4YDC5_METRE|nr:hypothetical protein [Pseudomonas resinovorans]MDA8486893.1 hypothetical protein [Pseudomonas resinovorans]